MFAHLGDELALLLGTFLGALVTSFAGFAFSPVAGIMMIGAVAPRQLVPLLMLCSVLIQLAIAAHSRRSLRPRTIGPMLLGGVVGVPGALLVLRHIDAIAFQVGFGLFLAVYALLMLMRPTSGAGRRCGPLAEGAIGMVGGFVGGLTAMPGAVPVLYADLCGLGKEAQRAMVQPFILSMQIFALSLMTATSSIDGATITLAAQALPALGAGTIVGLMLFRRVPDAGFRRVVLVVLMVTGASTAVARGDRLVDLRASHSVMSSER